MGKDILMIDVDFKYGDLYLRQLSTYHKSKGDRVHLGTYPNPDIVYVGCMKTINGADARGIRTYFPDAEVHIGGTGVNLNGGDPKITKLAPDYNLYPNDEWAIGRATWGCPNKCGYCTVPQKEGRFKRWIHPKEWYDDRFDTIYLLDNNLSYDKDWFMEVTDWILDIGLKVKENGMDFRFLDQDIAKRIKELEFEGKIHFAWDTMSMEKKVIEGLKILKEAGINIRGDVTTYVLTQYNTTREQDLYRCQKLRDMDTNPFVMVYGKPDKWHHDLQWKVGRKQVFWAKDNRWREGL